MAFPYPFMWPFYNVAMPIGFPHPAVLDRKRPFAEYQVALPASQTTAKTPKRQRVAENQPCLICGEPATGFHYTVASCHGCKTFFRRAVLSGEDFRCHGGDGNCVIYRDRNACRRCRLDKCLEMGMDKKSLGGTRDKRSAIIKRPLENAESESQVASPAGDVDVKQILIEQLTDIENRCNQLRSKDLGECGTVSGILSQASWLYRLNDLADDPETQFKEHRPATMSDIQAWNVRDMRLLLEWAKALDGFLMLSEADQERISMARELSVVLMVFALQLPLLLFHILVTFCVGRRVMRHDTRFSNGFYCMFLVQSVVEVMNYLAVTGLQLARLDFFLPEYLYLNTTNLRVGLFLCAYFLYIQFLSHTSIAINRYTVLLHPARHQLLWRGKRFRLVLAALLLLPLPGAITHFLKQVDVVAIPVNDGSRIYVVKYLTPDMALASFVCSASYNIVTSSVSFFLELRTVLVYRRLSPQLRLKQKEEYRLLVYALLQLVGQFLATLYYVAVIIALLSKDTALDSLAKSCYSYIINNLCLSSGVCLFFTSSVVRNEMARLCRWRSMAKCENNESSSIFFTKRQGI